MSPREEQAPCLLRCGPDVERLNDGAGQLPGIRRFGSPSLIPMGPDSANDIPSKHGCSGDAFDRDPEACVNVLVDAGVIDVEDDLYLTLPVSELRRPRPTDWIGDFSGSGLGGWIRRLAPNVRAALVNARLVLES